MTDATETANAAAPVPENPENRSKRLHGVTYAVVAALTVAGLSLSINQIFNLGAFGFRPVEHRLLLPDDRALRRGRVSDLRGAQGGRGRRTLVRLAAGRGAAGDLGLAGRQRAADHRPGLEHGGAGLCRRDRRGLHCADPGEPAPHRRGHPARLLHDLRGIPDVRGPHARLPLGRSAHARTDGLGVRLRAREHHRHSGAGHLGHADRLPGLRRDPRRRRWRSLLHGVRLGADGPQPRRPRQGGDHLVGPVRHALGQRDLQRADHRRDDDPGDEALRLLADLRGRGRGLRVDRRLR